jgi:hypothetical protein
MGLLHVVQRQGRSDHRADLTGRQQVDGPADQRSHAVGVAPVEPVHREQGAAFAAENPEERERGERSGGAQRGREARLGDGREPKDDEDAAGADDGA